MTSMTDYSRRHMELFVLPLHLLIGRTAWIEECTLNDNLIPGAILLRMEKTVFGVDRSLPDLGSSVRDGKCYDRV